ncbi:Inner membrane protein YghQ [Photobacterium piscicola]|uniref:Inner membrane protein YghQ n=1 Tax=Photobacterium piscicola TaxID=1378299 RepID=A0A1T5HVV8_9GAMM|nr:oligosaccharide flippase family protein [Photobacterium piscicola]SKC30949.1 Inner membrane protein YghQ [Photobacterium piscicola]
MKINSLSIKSFLLKDTFWVVVSNSVIGLSTLTVLSLIARNISIEEFGMLAISQSFIFTINGLLNFQTWQTIVKYFDKVYGEYERYSLYRISFSIDIITALLSIIVFILLLPALEYFYPEVSNYHKLFYLNAFILICTIEGTSLGYFRVNGDFSIIAFVDIFISFFKVILCYFLIFNNLYLDSIVLVFIFSALLRTLMLNILFFMKVGFNAIYGIIKSKRRQEVVALKGALSFSVYTSLTASFDVVFKQADTLIIGVLFGSSSAAMIKVLKSISSIFLQVISPLYVVVAPRVGAIQDDKVALNNVLIKSVKILLPSLLLLYGIIFVFKELIIYRTFGENYVEYSNYLMLYLVPIIISGVFTVIHPIFNICGFHKENLLLIVFSVLLYFSGIYFIKDTYGFIGILFMLILHSLLIVLYKIIRFKTSGGVK